MNTNAPDSSREVPSRRRQWTLVIGVFVFGFMVLFQDRLDLWETKPPKEILLVEEAESDFFNSTNRTVTTDTIPTKRDEETTPERTSSKTMSNSSPQHEQHIMHVNSRKGIHYSTVKGKKNSTKHKIRTSSSVSTVRIADKPDQT